MEKKKATRPTWAMVRDLEKERDQLKESIALAEAELNAARRELEKESDVSIGRLREIERLKNRNLFERILNR